MLRARVAERSRGGGRRALLVVLAVALLLVALYAAVELYCRGDARDQFHRLHGAMVQAEEARVDVRDGHEIVEVRLSDSLGLSVRGKLKVPEDAASRLPALLLLGGVRTGADSIDYIAHTRNVILFAVDYPYEGKDSGLSYTEFARAIPTMRRAVIRTVPAAMLGVDYLLSRPDVDPDRIVLVGGSVGALFAPAVGATDTRIAAVVLLFGGGDLQGLIRENIGRLGAFAGPASWLGKALTCPVEPLHYIGEISPRPVFLLNGTEDLGIPERYSRLLHRAAREPKTVRWIDAGHVLLADTEFHDLVTHELVTWLVEQDLIAPDSYIKPR